MPTLTALAWTLDWDTEQIDFDAEGQWSTTTDLDYTVTISSGFIVTAAIALVPCERKADTGALAWLPSLFGAQAIAEHAPFNDPTLRVLGAVESLTPPFSADLASARLPGNAYCSVYWLLAHGEPESDNANTSLRLIGAWQRGNATGTIDIDSDFARALIADLDPVPIETTHARLSLTRPMASIFDGIDFAADNNHAIAWKVLVSLTDESTFRLE